MTVSSASTVDPKLHPALAWSTQLLQWEARCGGRDVFKDDAGRYYLDQYDNKNYAPALPSALLNGAAGPQSPDLFRRYSASELVAMDRTFRWSVRGVLVRPTYGMIAGGEKTLKTYVALSLYVAVASATPLFGRFDVDQAGPVVAYVGEGGRVPYTRRLERVAAAAGVDLDNLPLSLTFDVAPILSEVFKESFLRDLEEPPALFGMDPFYAYHGSQPKAADLHQEGALLSSLSAPAMEAGTSLLVNNHFNQTGSGGGLKRITMAGGAEWCDSWLLLSHREPPDVDSGRFRLLLEIGSRQWGGSAWDLDYDLGRFDVDTGEYDGAIGWEIRRHVAEGGAKADEDLAEVVEQILADHPWELSRTALADKVGGNATKARTAIRAMEAAQRIEVRAFKRDESGRRITRHLVGVPGQLRPGEETE